MSWLTLPSLTFLELLPNLTNEIFLPSEDVSSLRILSNFKRIASTTQCNLGLANRWFQFICCRRWLLFSSQTKLYPFWSLLRRYNILKLLKLLCLLCNFLFYHFKRCLLWLYNLSLRNRMVINKKYFFMNCPELIKIKC